MIPVDTGPPAARSGTETARAMNSRDLIATARGLVGIGRRRPSQASLRRAVSTAYYAMFHCLAGTAADLLIGRHRSPAWHRVYRALDHGSTRNACQDRLAMREFPLEIQEFASSFVALQGARQRADYAFEGRYDRPDVLAAIDRAETAIEKIGQVDARHRRSFAAHVLFKRRSPQEVQHGRTADTRGR